MISFNLNLSINGSDTLTLLLIDDTTTGTLATLVYEIPTGNQIISGNFFFTMPPDYGINYSIVGSLGSHTITTTASMSYNIIVYQIFQ